MFCLLTNKKKAVATMIVGGDHVADVLVNLTDESVTTVRCAISVLREWQHTVWKLCSLNCAP